MILCLDLGNTRLKWGVFDDNNHLIEAGACMHADIETAPFYIWNKCTHAVLACVARDSVKEQMLSMLQRYQLPVTQVTASPACAGLVNGYDKPSQLGIDRWASVVAAWQHTKRACVVVNAGTAVTIDAIAQQDKNVTQAKFLGGYILPGLKMMHTRLSQGTAHVDVGQQNVKLQAFPTNTADAVQSGALLAVCGAIKHMAQQLKTYTEQAPTIVLTGGDAAQIQAILSEQALAVESVASDVAMLDHLVLQGVMLLYKESIVA